MAGSVLVVKDLHVSIEGKEILKGVNLEVKGGEIHAIMGPNGTGKSTLSSAIMGHPKYEVTQGSITLDGKDVLEMEVDERARAGLFLAMQYPSEISGVTNADFLRSAVNSRRGEGNEISLMKFIKAMDKKMEFLDMDALKVVSKVINEMRGEYFGCLLITHYQRLLNYITPDYVHVMMQGRVVKSGGPELAQKLEAEGYDWIKQELGIEDETVGQEA